MQALFQRSLKLVAYVFIAIFLFVGLVNADSLWVSNTPEEISEPGRVSDLMFSNEAVRLLYYHKNIAPSALEWGVWVQNASSANATLHYFKGTAGPSPDGVFVGHISTRQFMESRAQRRISSMVIAPGERVRLITQIIKPGTVISGLLSLMGAEGASSFRVQMGVVDPQMPEVSLLNELSGKNFYTGQYDKITQNQAISFFTRDNAKVVPIGGGPYLVERKTGEVLLGNYGLIDDMKIQVTNNLPVHATFEMIFSSAGGVGRGVLVINGQVIETTLFNPPISTTQRIFSQVLQPNQSITLSVSVMPQPGSNYPASLVLKGAPTLQLKGGST